MARNMIRYPGEELLAPRPTPKLEDLPLSDVRDGLFNIFAATLHIGGRSPIRNLKTRLAVVTGTHLPWSLLPVSKKIAVTKSLAAHSTVWFSISVVRKCHFYSVMKGTNLVSEILAYCSESIQLVARENVSHYGLIYVYLVSPSRFAGRLWFLHSFACCKRVRCVIGTVLAWAVVTSALGCLLARAVL
jgi:hypothetical protein